MSHNIYDINKAYNDFVKMFGIAPSGVVMNYTTHLFLSNESMIKFDTNMAGTFMGVPIYRSNDLETGKVRFVI